MALITAVSWHFGSTRASKSASHGPKHFAQEPAQSCSRQNQCGAANPNISPKTWHGLRFSSAKFGADLCRPEHLAKTSFPQSTVFSAKQARTCTDPSIQTRNLPRTTVLSATQARTLLRFFGNYKGYNRTYPNWSSKPSIPCRSHAPSLAIVWGEGGVRIK